MIDKIKKINDHDEFMKRLKEYKASPEEVQEFLFYLIKKLKDKDII